MQKNVFYSFKEDDECYTPRYGVKPLLEFLPRFAGKTIWCPFDTEDSEFVKTFKEAGYNVVHSHISSGQDFFEYEPDEWDVLISNPPFRNKRAFFERALSFGKPFALLMMVTWLNDAAPIKLFWEDLQLLLFDKRIVFDGKGGRPNFSSCYFCKDFLPKQICTRVLDIPKSSKKFHFLGEKKYETTLTPNFLDKIEAPSVIDCKANATLMPDEE